MPVPNFAGNKGTLISYGGMTMADVQTLGFSQEIVYDESGTDRMFNKFRIKVTGLVHDVASMADFGFQGSDPVTALAFFHTWFSRPRQAFYYVVGEQVVLAASPDIASGYADVNNGPHPLSVDVTEVIGKKVFRIDFEIEVCRRLCTYTPSAGSAEAYQELLGAQANNNVLSNRWSVSEIKDESWLTTRIIEGSLRVRHKDFLPHLCRYLCVPPLLPGYQRKTMNFSDTRDGLTLKYQIVEVQREKAPPWPAIDWRASCTETSTQNAAINYTEVDVFLVGQPDAPDGLGPDGQPNPNGPPDLGKKALLAAAIRVVEQRVGALQRNFDPDRVSTWRYHVENCVIVDTLHDNNLHVRVRVKHLANDEGFAKMRIAKIGSDLTHGADPVPGYSAKKWRVPTLYDTGTGPHGLFAKYWQDPCFQYHGIVRPMVTSSTTQPPSYIPYQYTDPPSPGEEQQDPILNDSSYSGWTAGQKAGNSYTYVKVEHYYTIATGTAVLPVSKWAISGSTATAKRATIGPPTCTHRVVVHCERMGDHPVMPLPRDNFVCPSGIRQWLISYEPEFESPTVAEDGKTLIYKGVATMVFGMERAPNENTKLPVGGDPRMHLSATVSAFPGGYQYYNQAPFLV